MSVNILAPSVFLTLISACACSIGRLSYAVKVYRSADITYYSWYTGLWTLPELAFGIVVACLPLLPKFLQGLKETATPSKIVVSLKSLLKSINVTSRGSTDNYSAGKSTNSNAPTIHRTNLRPGLYKTLSDRLPLGKRSHGNSEFMKFGDDDYYHPEAHIMRTINIDTRSESRGHNRYHSGNSLAMGFQGESAYGISVEA